MKTTFESNKTSKVSTQLFLGILLLPYVFVWLLLKKGYPLLTRILGFSWLLFMVVVLNTEKSADHSQSRSIAPEITSNLVNTNNQLITPLPAPNMSVEYGAQIKEIETRLLGNQESLKNYYASASKVKQATEDSLLLASIRLAYSGENRTQEELALKTKAEKLASKVIEQGRELYASMLQESFVKKGMDIDIEAKGKSKKTLIIKYVLMSQPLIYRFQNDMKLDEQSKQYGFTKIIYTNGFESELGSTWSVDL